MALRDHYLHIENDAEHILALKSSALTATEPAQVAFRRSVIAREQLRAELGLDEHDMGALMFQTFISRGNPPKSKVPLADKKRLTTITNDFFGASRALHEALAVSLTGQGMRTANLGENPELMMASPEGFMSGYELIRDMMDTMEKHAMSCAKPSLSRTPGR